jgi:hypothetical protein
MIRIRSGTSGRVTVAFPYNPEHIAKIKTIKGHRWHPEEKQWSFPYSKWVLTEILSVLAGEGLDIDPSLQALIDQDQKRELAHDTVWAKELFSDEPRKTRKEDSEWVSNIEDLSKELLFDRVRNLIRLKHYSIRTERTYLGWIKRYILFHNKRHPKDMGNTEIEAFLSHLAVDLKVSASTQNQAFNALLFLYRGGSQKGFG